MDDVGYESAVVFEKNIVELLRATTNIFDELHCYALFLFLKITLLSTLR
jgi:hypothetical protein